MEETMMEEAMVVKIVSEATKKAKCHGRAEPVGVAVWCVRPPARELLQRVSAGSHALRVRDVVLLLLLLLLFQFVVRGMVKCFPLRAFSHLAIA